MIKEWASQHTLISLIERWRKWSYGVAVLMNLSEAFDTLKHDLSIANLYAYGFDIRTLSYCIVISQKGGKEQK